MGKQVPFTNDKKTAVHIGNKTIRPGETREVELSMLPLDLQKKWVGKEPAAIAAEQMGAAPAAASALLGLLDEKVPDIMAKIGERDDQGFPIYAAADLDALEQAEKNGNTRKGVIQGIAEERLKRAAEAEDLAANSPEAKAIAEFVAALDEMDLQELQEELAAVGDDEGKRALVIERIDALAIEFKASLEGLDEAALATLQENETDEAKKALIAAYVQEQQAPNGF